MKIFLYFIGKPRDAQANAMAAEYVKRSRRYAPCEMREVQPKKFDPWRKHPGAVKIALAPEGEEIDSAGFTAWIARWEREGRDVVFLVGGADGLPEGWEERADVRLSLSRLTLPHELARVVLAEQVYRALTGLRGHPYPR